MTETGTEAEDVAVSGKGLRERLRADGPRGALAALLANAAVRGWAGPMLVTALGAWFRFADLARPQDVVFDETYYVPQAFGILRFGAEHAVSNSTDGEIVGGKITDIFVYGGQFSAHPPFGKIQIAAGEWLFGLNPFGWRFATALAGTLSILLLARITRRMTGSSVLGCVAGLLLALDGLELAMSRTAMLDIFVMFWALAGFGCLVADRDQMRARIQHSHNAAAAEHVDGRDPEPAQGVRWWRIGAGVCLGLATACKWNGLYFLVGFTLLSIGWEYAAGRAVRRGDSAAAVEGQAGRTRALAAATRAESLRTAASTLAIVWFTAAEAYLLTWSGWFSSNIGWDKYYAQQHGVRTPVVSALYSLFEYHREMLSYNIGLATPNAYQSRPWTWPLLTHPVRLYYAAPRYAQSGCQQTAGCVQNVLAVGTPAIWWVAIPALAAVLVWWLRSRDWRAGAALAGVAAGWLPWFVFAGRSQYSYYAVSFEPFVILALVLCIGLALGRGDAPRWRRVTGIVITVGYLIAVAVNFGYLYPVLTGEPVSHSAWLARLWFSGWFY